MLEACLVSKLSFWVSEHSEVWKRLKNLCRRPWPSFSSSFECVLPIDPRSTIAQSKSTREQIWAHEVLLWRYDDERHNQAPPCNQPTWHRRPHGAPCHLLGCKNFPCAQKLSTNLWPSCYLGRSLHVGLGRVFKGVAQGAALFVIWGTGHAQAAFLAPWAWESATSFTTFIALRLLTSFSGNIPFPKAGAVLLCRLYLG